jgi:SAM-dependent methyltransferase
MSEEHHELVRREFTRQAPTFTATGWAAANLDWIIAQIGPAGGEQVLEVAAGAAHLGRALTARTAHVAAIDLTTAVLRQGKAQADEQAQGNMLFQVGDAAYLPYLDASFDLVACRLAIHHFPQPGGPVAEMARVCRPGGGIAVADPAADQKTREVSDRLERLRDPSHARTLTPGELSDLLADVGASLTGCQTRPRPLELAGWLDRTQTPRSARHEITMALRAELDGCPPTGLRPHLRGGELWLTHTWAVITATLAA